MDYIITTTIVTQDTAQKIRIHHNTERWKKERLASRAPIDLIVIAPNLSYSRILLAPVPIPPRCALTSALEIGKRQR